MPLMRLNPIVEKHNQRLIVCQQIDPPMAKFIKADRCLSYKNDNRPPVSAATADAGEVIKGSFQRRIILFEMQSGMGDLRLHRLRRGAAQCPPHPHRLIEIEHRNHIFSEQR